MVKNEIVREEKETGTCSALVEFANHKEKEEK
jgi:hypothetical protein